MKLKFLSWNIWCGTYLDGVIEFLKTADADIVALQEVVEDDRGNITEIIAKQLGYQCVYVIDMRMPLRFLPGQKSDDKRKIKFGDAILSKYKIKDSKIFELATVKDVKRLTIGADIEVGNKTLHVFSVHLKHTHQTPSEVQDLEAENLLKIVPRENVVVMGDFNASYGSNAIKKMTEALVDTEIGEETPTWSVYENGCTGCRVESLQYKLDYIFMSHDLKSDSFKVHDSKSSDHLPVSATIEI